jgi:selenide,water dikinase
LDGAREYAEAGHIPGGASRNEQFVAPHIRNYGDLDETTRQIILDPQTSGGLLISVAPDRLDDLLEALDEGNVSAWTIGEMVDGQSIEIQ